VPEEAKKRRSDEGVKAQTHAPVVVRRGGAATHHLPTANSQQQYACDVHFVRPNRVLYALSSHFGEVIPTLNQLRMPAAECLVLFRFTYASG